MSQQEQRETRMQDVREVVSGLGLHPAHLSRVVGWKVSEGQPVEQGIPVTLGEYIAANAPDETVSTFGLQRPIGEQEPIRRLDQLTSDEQQQVVLAEYRGASDDFSVNGMNKAKMLRSLEAGIAGHPLANALISHVSLIQDLADTGRLVPPQPKQPNS